MGTRTHALHRWPVAELHDRSPEPEREGNLGERPVAAADRDHRMTRRRDRKVSRMADARDDDVVGPRVRVRVRLAGQDRDRRAARGLRAAVRGGHHLSEPAGDDGAAPLGEEAPDLLGLGRPLRPAADHCDLGQCHRAMVGRDAGTA